MRSGIISAYPEFLLAHLPGGQEPLALGEGGTPLIPVELPEGQRIYVKYEGLNPTGSFKDRGMVMAVSGARQNGARVIICASTGNTAASAAAYGARAGLRSVVVIPDGAVAQGKLSQALAAGAEVVALSGNFDRALEIVREICDQYPEIALVNSVNPLRLQGQKTAAFEVVDDLGRAPATLAIPVGNAGNISAYWLGFREYQTAGRSESLPRMIGVQAAGAAPLVLGHDVAEPETVATAIRIGRPASAHLARAAVTESGGRFLSVTDAEILETYSFLASQAGVFAEPASCASVAGLRKLARQGEFPTGEPVVAVLTGHGLKDPTTALKVGASPVSLPAELSAVREFLLTERTT